MTELDPICLTELDTDQAQLHAKYKARDFYFCSQDCYERFEATPDFYYKISE